MSCDKGHHGDCCCECEFQYKISVCSCRKCPKTEGYICIFEHGIDKNYGCSYSVSKHGFCEMFLLKKEVPVAREKFKDTSKLCPPEHNGHWPTGCE